MGGMGLKVGVYGGGGYAGVELVRLLAGHPEVGGLSVASRGYAGLGISDVHPQLALEGTYVSPEEIEGLDVAFVAYGHGESAETVRDLLRSGTRLVIDLSADFRLAHEGLYAEWYGKHPVPELLAEAHYGLPEIFGAALGRLVANPGCYPTAAILALAPVVRRMDGIRSVTINALSGVSGAGAKPSVKTHFVSVNESAGEYGATWNGYLRLRRSWAGTRRIMRTGRSWRRGRSTHRSRTWRTPTGAGSRRRSTVGRGS